MNFWTLNFWAPGFWTDGFWIGEEGGGEGSGLQPGFVLAVVQFPSVTVDLPQDTPPV